MLDSVADAIQGHKGKRGEADGYRHVSVDVMAEAIKNIDVPPLTKKDATALAAAVAPQ